MAEGKTDKAWGDILEDNPQILEAVEQDGFYIIEARDIKRYREPRLMTKFDTSVNVAQPLKAHDLDVLPNSRHSYVLGRFNLYEPFPDVTGIRPIPISLPDFETLRVDSLTSEANAINALIASRTLEDFLGEEWLVETFNGRMGTDDFSFDVNVAGGILSVDVHAAQLEIDGGFESDRSVVIMEAKNVIHDDFNVRQLYFPYRKYLGVVHKPIRLVFSQFTNLTYYLHEYEFWDDNLFSSIQHVRTCAYTFEDVAISWSDLYGTWERTRVETDDNQNTAPVPFIQADRFDRVLALLERINAEGGDMLTSDVAEFIGYVPRQAAYYPAAGEYLGLFEREERGHVRLTRLAEMILDLKYRDRQLAYASLMFRHEIFHRLFGIAYQSGTLPEKTDVVSLMLELNVCNDGATVVRRATSVISWLGWVMQLPEDE